MFTVITVVHIVACLFLIGVVLLQQGKGADMGAVFGGSSSTIFGSSGAGNFLTRLTTGTAVVFMLTSLTLTYTSARNVTSTVFDEAPLPEPPPRQQPAAPQAAEPQAAAPGAETVQVRVGGEPQPVQVNVAGAESGEGIAVQAERAVQAAAEGAKEEVQAAAEAVVAGEAEDAGKGGADPVPPAVP